MNYKKILSELSKVYFFTLLIIPLTYIIRIVYSKILTVEQYGLFYSFLALFLTLDILINLGLGEAFQYYIAKYNSKNELYKTKNSLYKILKIQLSIATIIAITLTIFKNQIATIYFKTTLAQPLILIFIPVLFLNIFWRLTLNFSKGSNEINTYSTLNPARLILVFVFASFIYIIKVQSNILNLLLTFEIISYSIIFMYIFLLYKKYKSRLQIKKYSNTEEFSKIKTYAKYSFLSGFAGILMSRIDIIMLTALTDLKFVALYAVAFPTASLIQVFSNPLKTYLFPLVSNLYHEKNINKINEILTAIYNIGFVIFIPISIYFILFANQIIEIMFGQEYIEAAKILLVLSIGMFFMSFTLINFTILDAIGKIKTKNKIYYFAALINIILNLILIFKLKAIGAAIATTIVYIILMFTTLSILVKTFKINKKNWIKIVLLNLALGILINILIKTLSTSIFSSIIIGGILGLVYLSLVHILKITNYKHIIKLIFNK